VLRDDADEGTTAMNARLTRAAFALSASGLLGLAALPPAAAADGGSATVSVFHGIPGATVDVYANSKKLLSDFAPGTLTAPVRLRAGTYDIEIFKAGADPSGTPVLEKTVDVPGGVNATVVASLAEDGQPALNAFVNDTSGIPAGKTRLIVRHVAAAPAVDVRANGTAVFKGLKNPEQATAEVPAGSVNADVVLAGTGTVVLGPATLNLPEGAGTVVYAWGSAKDKNLALKVQNLGTARMAPGAPAAGETGQADTARYEIAGWEYAVGGAALLGALVASGRLVIRRR
jgi:hypothetical protein